MPVLVYLDQAIKELRDELKRPEHKDLFDRIDVNSSTFEDVLAWLCTEFDIILNGDYSGEDINSICNILTRKLSERRKMEVVTNPVIMIPSPSKIQ